MLSRASSLACLAGALLVAGPAPGAPGSRIELRITYWPRGQGAGHAVRWTLRCTPPGGTLPRRAEACRRLPQLRRPFAPLPKNVACAQVYGGPEVAIVSGAFRAKRVWARFSRTDSCRIGRWNRLRFLFAET